MLSMSPGPGSLPGGCPPAPVVWGHDNGSRQARPTRPAHRPNRTSRPSTENPSRAIRPTASTSISRSVGLDPLVQRRDRVVRQHRHRGLRHDRAGVDARVDDEQRAARHLHAVLECLGGAVHARERRRQGRVRVEDAPAVRRQEGRADQLHEAGQDDQVRRRRTRRTRSVPRPTPRGPRSPSPGARTSAPRRARPAPAPRSRRGRRRRRRPRRRTPDRQQRRAGPGGWCRSRTPGRPRAGGSRARPESRPGRGSQATRWAGGRDARGCTQDPGTGSSVRVLLREHADLGGPGPTCVGVRMPFPARTLGGAVPAAPSAPRARPERRLTVGTPGVLPHLSVMIGRRR